MHENTDNLTDECRDKIVLQLLTILAVLDDSGEKTAALHLNMALESLSPGDPRFTQIAPFPNSE
jgi:hypothetical protein